MKKLSEYNPKKVVFIISLLIGLMFSSSLLLVLKYNLFSSSIYFLILSTFFYLFIKKLFVGSLSPRSFLLVRKSNEILLENKTKSPLFFWRARYSNYNELEYVIRIEIIIPCSCLLEGGRIKIVECVAFLSFKQDAKQTLSYLGFGLKQGEKSGADVLEYWRQEFIKNFSQDLIEASPKGKNFQNAYLTRVRESLIPYKPQIGHSDVTGYFTF